MPEHVAVYVERAVLILPAESAGQIARVVGAEHSEVRDLEEEITVYLLENPGAATVDVERGVGARGQSVRDVLHASERFQAASKRPGMPWNARCWEVASAPLSARPRVPDEGPESSAGRGKPK